MQSKADSQGETGDESTTEKIVQAARYILQSEGVAALTVRAAAKRAGYSSAAPYRHFAHGVPELLARIASEGFRELIAEIDRLPLTEDPRERVLEVILRYVRFGVDWPDLYRVLFDHRLARPLEFHDEMFTAGQISFSSKQTYALLNEVKADAFEAIIKPLVTAQQAGVLRSGDVEDFGIAVAALAHGLVGEFIDEGLWGRESASAAWSPRREEVTVSASGFLLSGLDAR